MVSLLLEHKANANVPAKNFLTPMHLAAQEDRVPVAEVLVKYSADVDEQTKAGYTPLHTASHFGQQNMVRFLLEHGSNVNATTKVCICHNVDSCSDLFSDIRRFCLKPDVMTSDVTLTKISIGE
jgi:ankyrin repeat protein